MNNLSVGLEEVASKNLENYTNVNHHFSNSNFIIKSIYERKLKKEKEPFKLEIFLLLSGDNEKEKE